MNSKQLDDLEEYCVGIIDFEDNINESLEGPNIQRLGKTIVKVKGNEGQIPHFHLVPTNGKKEICIEIYNNKYFLGTGHEGKFSNDSQCKQLYKWLKQNSIVSVIPMSNWEMIATMWNVANPQCLYKGPFLMPDYTIITE